jgi:YHS domain-containing protein
MKTLLAIVAFSFAIAGTGLSAPQAPINDKCPVCQKNARLIFHSNTPKGRVVFASADCKDKFDKSPTKYSVKPKS